MKKSDLCNTTIALIDILKSIEETTRHLAKLYSNPKITEDKKKKFETWIKQADTRSMAILTILRNRKDWKQ